jgi:hypothetical protein
MPYVSRNAEGELESLHRHAPMPTSDFLADGDPEVLAFLGALPPDSTAFSRLDADFVRVIEDLVDVLLSKNILNITDLPAEAQTKLFARKSFREKAVKNSLRLFETDFGDDVI